MVKYFLLLLLVVGCSTVKKNKTKPSVNSLTSAEFNYNFAEGNKNRLLGNTNQAILNFIRCLELKHENSAVYFVLSDIYNRNGDYKKAIEFGKKAYENDKKNFWYLLNLANLYKNTESLDSAISLYTKVKNTVPSNEDYNLTLAYLYFKNNKAKQATKILNDFQLNYGISENATLTLYQIYKYLNDYTKCNVLLKQAINKYPEDTRFYGLMAEHFLSINQMDSSKVYYDKLLALDPYNSQGILSLIEFYKAKLDSAQVKSNSFAFLLSKFHTLNYKVELIADLTSDKGYRRYLANDLPAVFDSLTTSYPSSEKVFLLKADFYLQQKDYKNAKTTLVQLVTNFKTGYAVWEQLFVTLNSLGNYNELVIYALKAAQTFPGNPYPFLFAGIGYFHLKENENSVKVLQLGLPFVKQKKELLIQFHTYLGENFQALKYYDKSEFHFEKVLQIEPLNYAVLNNYSYYLALRNSQLNKALNYITTCITKYPESSTYLDTYGWILFKQGDYINAKKAIEKALKSGGDKNFEIIEHYCEVLYYNNDLTNALKYYKILEDNGKSTIHLKKLLQIE